MTLDIKLSRYESEWYLPSFRCIVIALAALVFFCVKPAPAASNGTATNSQPNRPHISADDTSIDLVASSVEYTGNVKITFGLLEITADNVIIYYNKNAEPGLSPSADTLERSIISGNVKIVSEYGIATAREAVYNAGTKTLVLSGEPATLKSDEWDMESATIKLTSFTL